MSGQATGWVLLNGPRPDDVDRAGKPYGARARGLRAVLVAVADSANIEGAHSHPGTENVAAMALYSRRQTVTLLGELVSEGWLEVTEQGGGHGKATVYRLLSTRRPGVQPLHGRTVQPKPLTVQSPVDTVQPRLHPNGVPTDATNEENRTVRAYDPDPLGGFEDFWLAYPRNTAKGQARKAWQRAVTAAGAPSVIIDGAVRFACDPNRADEYTPHAATWLNGERWADDPLPARGSSKPQTPRERARRALATRREGRSEVVEL